MAKATMDGWALVLGLAVVKFQSDAVSVEPMMLGARRGESRRSSSKLKYLPERMGSGYGGPYLPITSVAGYVPGLHSHGRLGEDEAGKAPHPAFERWNVLLFTRYYLLNSTSCRRAFSSHRIPRMCIPRYLGDATI